VSVKPKIVVIVGPTASGKSDLAAALARKFNGEVVSADSRQVYRGMDIGTGKITKKEMKGVPHYLLDVASPKNRFSVSDYQKQAEKAINKILTKGKLPIICGGTGHYISALLGEQQIPEVPPNLKLRKQLEKKNVEELFKMLQKLDPRRAAEIDKNNPRRLVRAIEIAKALGKVPKVQNRSSKYEVLKIGIAPITHPNPSLVIREGQNPILNSEELKERIEKRLENRIKQGMVAEAKRLHKAGLSYKKMREFGLEYRRLADYLENKISKEEMIDLLKKEIWQYAKRQMTWFKRDKEIVWVEPKIILVEKYVKGFLN
jgi:tRNA dimethylallyltransferase